MTLSLLYLDPATGSLGYQVAISSLLAVLATGRIYWRQLKKLFARLRGLPEAREELPLKPETPAERRTDQV